MTHRTVNTSPKQKTEIIAPPCPRHVAEGPGFRLPGASPASLPTQMTRAAGWSDVKSGGHLGSPRSSPGRGVLLDYATLTASLGPTYGFGDWFAIPDEATGFSWKPGPRPWVLLQAADPPRPRLRALPRSSSWPEGFRHRPHPQSAPHGPCCVNGDGRLSKATITTLPQREFATRSYSCAEPDVVTLRARLGR